MKRCHHQDTGGHNTSAENHNISLKSLKTRFNREKIKRKIDSGNLNQNLGHYNTISSNLSHLAGDGWRGTPKMFAQQNFGGGEAGRTRQKIGYMANYMTGSIEYNITSRLALISLGLTLFSGILLSSPLLSATNRQTTATASITVAATCSMTATVDTAHIATLVNGTYSGDYTVDDSTPYANGIGKTTIQTFCNDNTGYDIYAVGYTNDTIGNNKLVGAGLSSTYDILTGTNTNGTGDAGDVSSWSMKVTAVTGTVGGVEQTYAPTIQNSYSNYSLVPSTYTVVASLDRATDSDNGTGVGSSIETTYAAYISNTQPAGTYTGQVKYALVHHNTISTELYTMQNIATWKNQLLPGVQATATDTRDGNTYTVALMEDGNVWMTQNLDLLIGGTYTTDSGVVPIVLDSTNTDLNQYDTNGDGTGTTFTHYTYDSTSGTITWAPTASTLTGSPATISGTTVTGWSNSYTAPYLAEGGDTYSVQGTRYNSLALCENNGARTKAQCMHYHVGNYYNFTAAVAMSDTSAYTTDNTVMPNSICPKGWRLPNGITDDNGTKIQPDFNALLKIYGITGNGGANGDGVDLVGGASVGWSTNGFANIGLSPLFFVRSGRTNASSLNNFGAYGYYWSSTVRDEDGAYSLDYDSTGLRPALRGNRYLGRSVRCMAR